MYVPCLWRPEEGTRPYELEMVVSCPVTAGDGTLVLWKSNQGSLPLSHLSHTFSRRLAKILPSFFFLFGMAGASEVVKNILLFSSFSLLEILPGPRRRSSEHAVHWAAPQPLIASSVDLCSEVTSVELKAGMPGGGLRHPGPTRPRRHLHCRDNGC